MKRVYVIVVSLVLTVAAWGQDSLQQAIPQDSISFSAAKQVRNATKEEADSAYIQGDYAAAIQIYENLLLQGEAAEVYYNLGNAYYKADEVARAILNYERALLLQPGNGDIKANLEIARAKTIDKVVQVPDIFFIAWIKAAIHSLSLKAWAVLAISCFLLLLGGMLLFFISKRIVWKKAGFFTGIACAILTVVFNIFASYQRKELENRDKAIIVAPSVTVRSTPSERGTSLFILHEGHKVTIKDASMKEWNEIQLEDGKVGWVPVSSMEVI